MLIKRTPSWAIRESEATPEAIVMGRRGFVGAAAAGVAAALGATPAQAGWLFGSDEKAAPAEKDPSAGLYPVKRNTAYKLDRPETPEAINLGYNNFYEFGTTKYIADNAQKLPLRPWSLKIGGLVETPREVGIDDLLKALPLEERLYRHRCVEAWGMALPWSGIPMKDFVAWAKPLSSAKYVKMTTFMNPSVASGQRSPLFEWPYTEGLTIAEATSELAFLATGAYGKPLAKQMGAPIRLVAPWKYGFKSVKSIVSIEFTDKQPDTLWRSAGPGEYGFWANVNPAVAHPRWSQARERVLGTDEAEATSELAFLATGAYGKPLAKQMGAPIRLVAPWKYGFKSVKSIVSIEFTDKQPDTLWRSAGPGEYGFWANVNPAVAHPRWSQARERVLGTDEMKPTLLFNGYAEQVAGLYKGLEKEKLYM